MNAKSSPLIETADGPMDRVALTQALRRIAIEAGAVIMPFFKSGTEVREKENNSPVTDADEAAEKLILEALGQLTPDIPVIAEEAMAAGQRPEIGERFFLVDPLDGTKEFISGRGEFTVNIALIENRVPVAGVVFAPALKRLFAGAMTSPSTGTAFEEAAQPQSPASEAPSGTKVITARAAPEKGLVAVASRSHRAPETEEFLKQFRVESFISAGSSLKFCLVATGEADIYPRHGRTMEWDTAAGHAVLIAAGGSVTCLDGAPFLYGKDDQDFANPFFVARGRMG